ncbi:MAG: L-histidine N(alpha)-methyltransferase [Candidatus Kapaibacterium sp.]
MPCTYKILTNDDLKHVDNDKRQFALDVLLGLSEHNKKLSSKYFYDDRGSEIFQKIMELPEYYLTKCEFEILRTRKDAVRQIVDNGPFNFVELGAGDGRKTSIIIEHFLDSGLDFKYVPIDISEGAMKYLINSFDKKFPRLEANGLVTDYFLGLDWLSSLTNKRNFVLFLGSNLGNFNKAQSRVFLRNLWNALNDGDMLMIGFDLKKDLNKMLAAYNDSSGVTARFNLNLLRRINRELGGDFDLDKYRFYSSYDVFSGAMESYLVSQQEQEVFISEIGQRFQFRAWEPIHMEYSYKYLISDIERLAELTGFEIVRHLFDSGQDFVDSVWKVRKETS